MLNRIEYKRIEYKELNAKAQENYNFAQLSGVLADFGFNCIKLSDDYRGADFLACHKDLNDILKIQLKGRLTYDKKYEGKELYIGFRYQNEWYLVPHDESLQKVKELGSIKIDGKSWGGDSDKGEWSWNVIPPKLLKIIEIYKIPDTKAIKELTTTSA